MQTSREICSKIACGMLKRSIPLISLVFLIASSDPAQHTPSGIPEMPKLLSLREQMDVREGWLKKRFELLLPMMRRHGVDMWIVVNEEFHSDPVTEHIV